MKTIQQKFFTLCLLAGIYATSFAQNTGTTPYSFTHQVNNSATTVLMPYHDFAKDIADAEVFQKNGNYPRFAYHYQTDYTLQNSGAWQQLANGDRIWTNSFRSAGALSLALFFDNFYLPEGSLLSVYSPDKNQYFTYGYESNQGNFLFSTEFVRGEEIEVEYYEPKGVANQGGFRMTALSHQYRSIAADPCEVNIICSPEGDNWVDEKHGVCRVYVVEGTQAGYCSGSLVNNTALDCKRYILTAFHCGTGSTTANFNQWVFRFNFEATTCTGQADTFGGNNFFTGCAKRADSGDNGGTNGSDFLLLQINATTVPAWWNNVYFNGWTRQATAPTGGGVGIHHPNGDNKKISAFSGTPVSTYWQGGTPTNTHWRVTWVATTNGHGVTEGGSSGSPLFTNAGLIFGTLTGGGSFCTSPTQPDSYGKFAYHWTSNGTTAANQLQPWLDPNNTGATSLLGAYSPCSATGIHESSEVTETTLFPNPAHETLSINTTHNIQNVKLFNVVGEMVYNSAVNQWNNVTIDVSMLKSGVYFVEIQTGVSSTAASNGIVRKKFVKE